MSVPVKVSKTAQLTGHNGAVYTLAPGFQAGHVLSCGGDGWIVNWDLEQPELGKLLAKVPTQVFAIFPLADHGKVVAGDMNGGVHWVNVAVGEETRSIAHHTKGVFGILRIRDRILTIGGDGVLTSWSIATTRSMESVRLSAQSLRSIDFCAERNELAIGASDHRIYILRASDLTLKHTIQAAHDNSVFSVRFSPSGHLLYSGGRDAHLRIWDADRGFTAVRALPAHYFTINDMVFDPTGRWLATASRDKTIKIWDTAQWDLLKVIEAGRDGGHINSVNRLLWLDSDKLLSASDDRRIILWKTQLQ